MDRNFEFKYMADFAYESYLIEELARDQFRALWMAYCLHHNLDADTSEYDDDLAQLWNVVSENGDGTTEWSDYDSFNNFMSRYLVLGHYGKKSDFLARKKERLQAHDLSIADLVKGICVVDG